MNDTSVEIKPSESVLILFGLETSGTKKASEILEIAAASGEETFNIYITPQNPIDPKASAVNNLTMMENVLYYKDTPVESVTLEEGMQQFLTYLEGLAEPRLLVGHNVKKFDCQFLIPAVTKVGLLDRFNQSVVGFIDTLSLYREIVPGLSDYKQSTIAKNQLSIDKVDQTALEDVLSLQTLFNSSSISDDVLVKHSFTRMDLQKKI